MSKIQILDDVLRLHYSETHATRESWDAAIEGLKCQHDSPHDVRFIDELAQALDNFDVGQKEEEQFRSKYPLSYLTHPDHWQNLFRSDVKAWTAWAETKINHTDGRASDQKIIDLACQVLELGSSSREQRSLHVLSLGLFTPYVEDAERAYQRIQDMGLTAAPLARDVLYAELFYGPTEESNRTLAALDVPPMQLKEWLVEFYNDPTGYKTYTGDSTWYSCETDKLTVCEIVRRRSVQALVSLATQCPETSEGISHFISGLLEGKEKESVFLQLSEASYEHESARPFLMPFFIQGLNSDSYQMLDAAICEVFDRGSESDQVKANEILMNHLLSTEMDDARSRERVRRHLDQAKLSDLQSEEFRKRVQETELVLSFRFSQAKGSYTTHATPSEIDALIDVLSHPNLTVREQAVSIIWESRFQLRPEHIEKLAKNEDNESPLVAEQVSRLVEYYEMNGHNLRVVQRTGIFALEDPELMTAVSSAKEPDDVL